MSTLEVPAAGWWLALAVLVATPGVHLLCSLLLERRRITWRDDYPAVLVGDPLLALAVGLSGLVAEPSGWLASGQAGALALATGAGFGAWQLRDELRKGRYAPEQAFSPSKLWHQFVVYGLLGHWVSAAVWSAVRETASLRDWLVCAAATACLLAWAALAVEAMRVPRLGHGAFSWRHLHALPVVEVRVARGLPPRPLAGSSTSTPRCRIS